tara:strand:+ start:724 stop:867 length:144 start_codon:yes stop_codon:yes gene_type:complete
MRPSLLEIRLIGSRGSRDSPFSVSRDGGAVGKIGIMEGYKELIDIRG